MTPRGFQEWMYIVIVGALAAYLVIGILTWSWMIFNGIRAPGAFTSVLAAVVGALAGVLSPLRAPGGREGDEGG